MSNDARIPGEYVEILSEAAFTVKEVARASGTAETWVHERVEAGVLLVHVVSGEWRFDSTMLIRARRIAELESIFDADPQLAALTVDLMDDVARLRRQLRMLGNVEST
jgi:chaperone modulatory protein CbpM